MQRMASTDKRREATEADDRLRETLRSRLREMGISAREASRRAGKNLGFVGDILDGRSKAPEGENILKLARALDLDAADLVADSAMLDALPRVSPPNGSSTAPFRQEDRRATARVPIYAAALPVSAPYIDYQAEPIGTAQALPFMGDAPEGYCVAVPNELNAPRYLAGETLFVKPGLTPRPGACVFVRLKSGRAGIGRLERITPDSLVLGLYNPGSCDSEVETPLTDVESVHAIVGLLH